MDTIEALTSRSSAKAYGDMAPTRDHLDVILCHDIEFVDMRQIVEETLPALRKVQQSGKVRFVGISGYPMNIFKYVLDRADLDVILSYNHYTLQNTMLADLVPYLKGKGVGIMNAAPSSARLLTNTELPKWHKATPQVRKVSKRAADHIRERTEAALKLREQAAHLLLVRLFGDADRARRHHVRHRLVRRRRQELAHGDDADQAALSVYHVSVVQRSAALEGLPAQVADSLVDAHLRAHACISRVHEAARHVLGVCEEGDDLPA